VILADTSVWVDHLRSADRDLARLLEDGRVFTHPFIIGELALGEMRNRDRVLEALLELPRCRMAEDSEVLHFIREAALHGRGIGYIDVHLLASLRLTPGARLWTKDRRLGVVAEKLALAAVLSK
jgi:predicted nucleic acid-binding protein